MGGHQAQREKKPIDLRADGRTGLSRVFCIDQAGTFVGWIELCTALTERGYARLSRLGYVDGRVPRRAWPPHRRQRRVPRRSGQHGPSPEEECLRSRPRCSEVTQLQEQGPHRKQPNWVRMCYVLFSYVTYSILMCTRYSCEYEVVGVMRSC